MTYRAFVVQEAKAIGSDGCTHVPDIHKWCCYEHDLGYHHGRDPRSAYERYGHAEDHWAVAQVISRREIDRRFRHCIQADSRFGAASPMAWWRWAGVRVGGWFLWRH